MMARVVIKGLQITRCPAKMRGLRLDITYHTKLGLLALACATLTAHHLDWYSAFTHFINTTTSLALCLASLCDPPFSQHKGHPD